VLIGARTGLRGNEGDVANIPIDGLLAVPAPTATDPDLFTAVPPT
jgi:hypothetical protein